MPVIVPVQDTQMRYSPPPPPYTPANPIAIPAGQAPSRDQFTFRVDYPSPDFKHGVTLYEDHYEQGPPQKRTKL